MKKLFALLLALAMILSLAACGGGDTPETTEGTKAPTQGTTAPTDAPTEPDETEPAETEKYVIGTHLSPDNDPYIEVKYTVTSMADGWIKVENKDGETLGYSPDSGVSIIQIDGYAFKDLDQDGLLDVYEDWRRSAEERALDLAAHMSGEEATPYLTHGGWGSFTTEEITPENSGYTYIMGGGRGGVTRKAGSSTEDNVAHAQWANLIQELCESSLYGIPGVISIDPNDQAGLIEALSLAATFDPETAVAVGTETSIQYRAMGIHMLLGPQIDLMTSPVMDRGETTYGEDPALVRDITNGFVSGMQSTFAEDGSDLGWGTQSVVTTMKHFAGAGAAEGGRDDHAATGKYAVFPSNNFEAHLIAFHDGAFDLSYSSTGAAAGVMMNYSVSYSEDGSLGELVGGVFSTYKFDLLHAAGWTGFVVSDWGCFPDGGRGGWGMEDYTVAQRIAIALTNGMTQAGGYNDLTVMAEVWTELVNMHGEEAALELVRDRAYENILMTLRLGLFENPYCDTEYTASVCCTDAARAYALETQLDSVVMLKNTDNIISAAEEGAEKLTVYVPYVYNNGVSVTYRNGVSQGTPSWAPSLDLDVVSKYYNVVTDTLGEPTGKDADGNAIYTENDIIRADTTGVDLVLIGMDAPKTPSYTVTDEDGNITAWIPSNIQYGEYTAVNAKDTSVAGDVTVKNVYDPYGAIIETETIVQNRSYKGQTAVQSAYYNQVTTLQMVNDTLDVPVIVLMQQNDGAMVWTEVEPLADAILVGYAISDEAMVMTAAGLHEPNGLLVNQQPASMDAVEAQADDVPRDVECHVDANGNTYDFAFGMNWSGVINDERVATYSAPALTESENLDFFYANENG